MQDDTLSWQQAVAVLTAERGRAEAAVAVIKRLGGPSDRTRAEITYGMGRAEAEAVIGALVVALDQGNGADDLTDLETRIAEAASARQALGTMAQALADAGPTERSVLVDLIAQSLPSLLSAIGALWNRRGDSDEIARKTIATRLEAARWPAFDAITG